MVEETESYRFIKVNHLKTYRSDLRDSTKIISTIITIDLKEITFYEKDKDPETEEVTGCTIIYSKSGLLFKIIMEYEEFDKLHTSYFDNDHFWFPPSASSKPN